ncbi:hypothetical protein GCM10009127_10300 [Alteraurantiacibacter aestuarii]|uniref:histidine kinase n=1 Tax=Alteraurantiacibacter aestuarii TaxID=650004 RepID=A0A844ZI05_9SPHN|nr:hypothetical protein [Alteraurantiacibacter aestuarii]MXO87418.1 hypothetical protein [Alteraurantiacibacter aestuarii]
MALHWRKDWPQLLFAILVLQALYWLFLTPVFDPQTRPLERILPIAYEVATLASPDWDAVEAAQFEATDVPWEDCCEEGYRAFRVIFELDTVPREGIGEVPVVGADNYQAWINGSLHYGAGRMVLPDLTYHGRAYRGIHRLPAGVLNVGRNEITYILASHEGTGGFLVAEPTLGEYDQVVATFNLRRFLLNDYLQICTVVGFLVALLAFVAWARSGRQGYLFWLGMLSFSWAGMLFHEDWADPPIGGRLFMNAVVPLGVMIPAAWVNLSNNWAGRPLRFVLPLSMAGWLLCIAIFLIGNFLDPQNDAGPMALWAFSGAMAVLFAGLILWKMNWIARDRFWEAAIFLLLAVMSLRDYIGRIFDLNIGTQTDYALPFLLVALAASFLSRNIRLFRSAEEINALLQVQLDERTAELAVAHDREKILLSQQAHQDERRRIMADMHDGLGSQLMSMLLSARRGNADPAQYATGLQSAIDEMRLMIDSMDSVGESLAAALVLFRERAQARVLDAGFAFDWQQEPSAPLPQLPPRAVLQVFRILQEAVTNALKHSSGDSISVHVSAAQITISDNGDALGKVRTGGRGLDNMAARAGSIGGIFELERVGEMTVARLQLPGDDEGADTA